MNIANFLVPAAIVVLVVATGSAVHEKIEIHKTQTALVAATQKNASLRSRLQQEEVRAAEIEQRLQTTTALAESLKKNADETAKAASSSQVKQSATPSNADPAARKTQIDLLAASPEYQELVRKDYRGSLRLTFGPLYRKLGLSPQQIADFETAQVEARQAMNDFIAAARGRGLSLADPRLTPLNEATFKAVENQLHAALGDAGYAEYKAYSKLNSARRSVEPLVAALYYTETPMSATQGNQLVQWVAKNTTRSTDASGLTRLRVDWDKIAVQAKEILKPYQLDTLQALAEKDRLGQQSTALWQKLTEDAINAPPSSTSR